MNPGLKAKSIMKAMIVKMMIDSSESKWCLFANIGFVGGIRMVKNGS